MAHWVRSTGSGTSRALRLALGMAAAVGLLVLQAHEALPQTAKIGFTSSRDGIDQLYIMNADGSSATRLTAPPGISSYAKCSPDGRTIAFFSNRSGTNQIYAMGIDGGAVQWLTEEPGANGEPAFSPDGTRIVFSSNRSGPFQVYVMGRRWVEPGTPHQSTRGGFHPIVLPLDLTASRRAGVNRTGFLKRGSQDERGLAIR